ncbi:hypothetical protein THAOC_07804 [Thalassiosira oceanica]|uniref:Uncharacterized protein n=1 Tax=Thalassiosira oceanica TaxID=159749 RepID=K0TBK2_THAOC|nr:hypothetical protein THAOC_07804 [Thalassiosira oceanica]|eukprot:EJK70806.1 hypothetical protein THAOC_07804 [Thalassiosira oceanica]
MFDDSTAHVTTNLSSLGSAGQRADGGQGLPAPRRTGLREAEMEARPPRRRKLSACRLRGAVRHTRDGGDDTAQEVPDHEAPLRGGSGRRGGSQPDRKFTERLSAAEIDWALGPGLNAAETVEKGPGGAAAVVQSGFG